MPVTPPCAPLDALSSNSYVHPTETNVNLSDGDEHEWARQAGGILANGQYPGEMLSHPYPWIHKAVRKTREAIIRALADDPEGSLHARSHRLQTCCSRPVMYTDESGHPVWSLGRCRDRLCPTCATHACSETAERVISIMQEWDVARHLVLTVKASNRPLREQIDDLLYWFRRLRSERFWKENVRGGVATLEFTWNAKTWQWHPHIHVLVDGEYLEHARLKHLWQKITGDSTILHISLVPSKTNAGRYISKYLAKPSDIGSWHDTVIREYASAIAGRRTLLTFGSSHGHKMPQRADPDRDGALRVCAYANQIREAVADDHPHIPRLKHLAARNMQGLATFLDVAPLWRVEVVLEEREAEMREIAGICAAIAKWWSIKHAPPPCHPPERQSRPIAPWLPWPPTQSMAL